MPFRAKRHLLWHLLDPASERTHRKSADATTRPSCPMRWRRNDRKGVAAHGITVRDILNAMSDATRHSTSETNLLTSFAQRLASSESCELTRHSDIS